MSMTPKQRNFFLWCGVILVALYVTRTIILSAAQARYYREQAVRAAQLRQAKPKPGVPAAAVAPSAVAAPAPVAPANANIPGSAMPMAKLPGVWHGRAALPGRGLCDMRFELREKGGDAYSGNSISTCFSVSPMMSAKDRGNGRTAMMNHVDPDTAIMTGKLENGAIHFQTDKTIGTDINGCTVTSLTLTPVGNSLLGAEWQSGQSGQDCQSGHMLLGKVGK